MTDKHFNLTLNPISFPDAKAIFPFDQDDDYISPEERRQHLEEARKLTDKICTDYGQDIFIVMGNLTRLLNVKNDTFQRATTNVENLIQAVNHIYDPKRTTIAPTDAAIINSLFLQMNHNVKLDPDTLDDEEQAILDIQQKSTFFSRCFMKKSPLLTDLALRFWAKYDGDFIDFLKRDDDYLNQTIPAALQDRVKCKGLDHLINNPFFAGRTMELIPVKQWNNHILVSLFICALDKNIPTHFLDTFVKKLESDPDRASLKYHSQTLVSFLKDNYTDPNSIITADESIDHLVRLLSLAKSPELKTELSHFLKSAPTGLRNQIIDHLKTDTDYKSFVDLYAQNSSGPSELLSFKRPDGQNVIWDLYDKSLLSPELMGRFIDTAMHTNRLDFLMLPKKSHLTPALPKYTDLCHFFADMPHQALHFIASFHQNDIDDEKRGELITDFINSPAIKKPLFCRYHILNHWIKNKQYNKAADFFFGTTTEPIQTVEPTMTQAELDLFWTRKDAAQKNPWHYLCECKEKCFFKRHFKPLHASFLKACRIPDATGRTPLDYASDNLKFMQYIADKIPAVAKLMAEAHYSLDYQPTPKPVLDEPTTPSVPQRPQRTEAPSEQWHIVYYGSDSELKNPQYKKLIEEEVAALPPPKSAAMRERINRDKKIDTYNASALKTHWNGARWRLPYVVYGSTIYILPGAARKEAYKQPQAQLIRSLVAKLKKELNGPILIGHHDDPPPPTDSQNQKN